MAINKEAVWADAFVRRLVERSHLELTSPAGMTAVVARIADALRQGAHDAPTLSATLIDSDEVAELSCDDKTVAATLAECIRTPIEDASAMTTARARPAQVTPESRERKLHPDVLILVERAENRARERGHRQTTLTHLLTEILAQSTMVALAEKRGGDPKAAHTACNEALGSLAVGQAYTGLAPNVVHALENAEEEVPRFAYVGDIVLAVLKMTPEHPDQKLYRVAFDPPPSSPVKPEELFDALDDREPAERGPGRLVLSAELNEALQTLYAVAVRHAERWTVANERFGTLSARLVLHIESELGAVLPDDFWAAIAARLDELAELGVVPMDSEGRTLEGVDSSEAILGLAANTAFDLPEGLVAVHELSDTETPTYFCVRRGVPFADRNRQTVWRVDAVREEDLGTFGEVVLRSAREAHGEPVAVGASFSYRARLRDVPSR